MKAALVSANDGKLRELRRLLPGWDIQPLDTAGIGEEVGVTFEENARAKALWGRPRTSRDVAVVGEDSGLEVEGLAGAPGIRSARFGGSGATDEGNVERLLAALAGIEGAGRRARYVCVLVLIAPDGTELVSRGTLEGSIAPSPAGTAGFGYDPVFVPEGKSRTVGQLGERWKERHSHRAAAARLLAAEVEARRGRWTPAA